jgi:hypothetical protein
MRRGLLGCALALPLACATGPSRAPLPARAPLPELGGAGRPALVVLVSVAGLTPERALEPEAMPFLSALARQGVAAERVDPVAPAAAYPAHASFVTGVAPAQHGIVADRLLGERGVRRAAPSHASQLRAATLWQRVAEAGGGVAAFDWPTTTGAEIASLLPDVSPERDGERWEQLAASAASASLAERLRAAPAAAAEPGPGRDAFLVDLACAAFAESPRLLLVRLRGSEAALLAGPASDAAAAAFRALDGELARLVACAERAGVLGQTAFVVTGDRAVEPVHSALRPNGWLREAGWITPQGRWRALLRSNGRSAFLYAEDARIALQARQRLEERARETGAFRVVSAEQMIARGADPEAWIGLEAEPGFVFENGTSGAALAPSALLGAGGALDGEAASATGLVAFGRGIRPGVRVPRMSQLDVAPTLAALLGVTLEAAQGRSLVGLLELAPERR